MKEKIIIATRSSPLALWQAEWVKANILAAHPHLQVELKYFKTQGDKILDTPLAKIGGKGLFVKELEVAILEGEADMAVHSMKDVPVHQPEGLEISIITERHSPFDAFVSNRYAGFLDLPQGAKVGTSSLRRVSQLKKLRPDIHCESLRGNVQTRLGKLDSGEFDAIILASAGLKRLGLDARITEELPPEISLPAIGQGVVSIETRKGDEEVLATIRHLHHAPTASTLAAERGFLTRLNGGCQVPLGGFAVLEGNQVWLRGLIASPTGERYLAAEIKGPKEIGAAMGVQLAEDLLQKGGREILAEVGIETF